MASSKAPTEGPTVAAPTTVSIRTPSKYASSPSASSNHAAPPSLPWLSRTWSVTHSTLAMWRTAQNVRITYGLLPSRAGSSDKARLDDLVEYEALGGKGGTKSVTGVDTASAAEDTGSWDWRGKGLLFWVRSHWEVLGWGERPLAAARGGGVERWAVTWFAPTLFTKEGVDIYCDRSEGLSEEAAAEIITGLKALEARPVAEMVERDMLPVAISLPWTTK